MNKAKGILAVCLCDVMLGQLSPNLNHATKNNFCFSHTSFVWIKSKNEYILCFSSRGRAHTNAFNKTFACC